MTMSEIIQNLITSLGAAASQLAELEGIYAAEKATVTQTILSQVENLNAVNTKLEDAKLEISAIALSLENLT